MYRYNYVRSHNCDGIVQYCTVDHGTDGATLESLNNWDVHVEVFVLVFQTFDSQT